MGDSLTKFLDKDLADPGFHYRVETCPGATISTIRNKFKGMPVMSPAPDVIFVHVGTNDFSCYVQQRSLNDMRSLIRTIQERYPLSQLFINKVLPRFDWVDLDNCRFYFNIELSNIVGRGVNVVDAGANLGESMYGTDGLHLKRSGYRQFALEISSAIQPRPIQGKHNKCMMPPFLQKKKKKKDNKSSHRSLNKHEQKKLDRKDLISVSPSHGIGKACETEKATEQATGVAIVLPYPVNIPTLVLKSPYAYSETPLPSADTPYIAFRKSSQRRKRARQRARKARSRKKRKQVSRNSNCRPIQCMIKCISM